MVVRGTRQAGGFVHVKADAVTDPVAETILVPGRIDEAAGRGIHLGCRLARGHSLYRRGVGLDDEVVDGSLLVRSGPQYKGPGHIAAVPVPSRAVVDQHEVALLERAFSGGVMDV